MTKLLVQNQSGLHSSCLTTIRQDHGLAKKEREEKMGSMTGERERREGTSGGEEKTKEKEKGLHTQ